ncbi:hypothetical protein M569_03924, partial [Genlisea aurea]
MAAYSALLTLARNIQDQMHGDLPHQDLKLLLETSVQLQDIMENCPQPTLSQAFEARIRDYAYRAADAIEFDFLQLLQHNKLQELSDEAASLVLEATRKLRAAIATDDSIMQFKGSSSSSSSSSVLHTHGGATRKVRLYSDNEKLEERLYEGCSERQVIPI